MHIMVTGGSGVLGRFLVPLLRAANHQVDAPAHSELNLFDAEAVRAALSDMNAVYHLATRIPTGERAREAGAWEENNRLRSLATRLLVDAALDAGVGTFVLPSITFLYPEEGPVDEDTPFGEPKGRLSSMLDAERQVSRFAEAGRQGVTLRLGLLWGPGTGNDAPVQRYGASVHVEDAAAALRAALDVPGGVYNVVGDGERVANGRFKAATGWAPRF